MKDWLFGLIPYVIGLIFLQLSGITDGMSFWQVWALGLGIAFIAIGADD